MHDLLPTALLVLQVIFIDLVLAGDNAIVVGMAAAGLPPGQRGKAIAAGIGAATLLRICFALGATMLLNVVGLLLAGGLLLLWVCWKMWRELREGAAPEPADTNAGGLESAAPADLVKRPSKTLRQAIVQIVAADVSMSLDNVLAVAGAVQGHPVVLVLGLTLSVALMGVAASLVARLLGRWRWITYVGLMVILLVAASMIYRGILETFTAITGVR